MHELRVEMLIRLIDYMYLLGTDLEFVQASRVLDVPGKERKEPLLAVAFCWHKPDVCDWLTSWVLWPSG